MAVDCLDSGNYVSKILSDRRKAKKPMMEKMRRARINDSLNELKTLVLQLLNKDASRYSKMEKADILEMTVGYMRAMQRKDKHSLQQDASLMAEYRAGFNQCATEVTRNLSSAAAEGSNDKLREKLMSHLASCCHGNATSPVAPSTMTTVLPAMQTGPMWAPYPSPPPSPIAQGAVVIPRTALLHTSEPVKPVAPVSPPYFTAHKTFGAHAHAGLQSPAKVWRPW